MVLVALANAERPTLTHRLSLAYPASVTTERVGINGTERVGIEEVTLTLAHAVAIDAGSLVLLNVDRFAVLADLDDGRRGAVATGRRAALGRPARASGVPRTPCLPDTGPSAPARSCQR